MRGKEVSELKYHPKRESKIKKRLTTSHSNLGVRMIDESPREGAHETKIAFVHPEATGGLLVELVEQP